MDPKVPLFSASVTTVEERTKVEQHGGGTHTPPSTSKPSSGGPEDDRSGNAARSSNPATSVRASRWERWLARRIYRRLQGMRHGVLQIDDHAGRHQFGSPVEDLPICRIQVDHPRFYRDLAWQGSMGAADAYLRGDWSVDDLVPLFQVLRATRKRWKTWKDPHSGSLPRSTGCVRRRRGIRSAEVERTSKRTTTWATSSFAPSWMRR